MPDSGQDMSDTNVFLLVSEQLRKKLSQVQDSKIEL